MINAIQSCRVCSNPFLDPVIDLGEHSLSGVFPRDKKQQVLKGPLEVVACRMMGEHTCGLVQLKHNYDASQLYGDHYGYRSSLNKSMVDHLYQIVKRITSQVALQPGDIVLDIGSNDSTLLQAYKGEGLRRIGMDPAANKFRKYYPHDIELVDHFFSANHIREVIGTGKIKVITSIAMFYDLHDPLSFMRDIHDILDDQGLWVFEQSYLPAMLSTTSYDTICHEHVEYYGLRTIIWMAQRSGLKVIDVIFNDVNGGSFQVWAVKANCKTYPVNERHINSILNQEAIVNDQAFKKFRADVFSHREALIGRIGDINKKGENIIGYGASTKGNVILQFCGLTSRDISCIAEVNEDKFGCFTPGTYIPIVSEQVAQMRRPHYMLVLPWHFKDHIIKREQAFIKSGGTLMFPLPVIHQHR